MSNLCKLTMYGVANRIGSVDFIASRFPRLKSLIIYTTPEWVICPEVDEPEKEPRLVTGYQAFKDTLQELVIDDNYCHWCDSTSHNLALMDSLKDLTQLRSVGLNSDWIICPHSDAVPGFLQILPSGLQTLEVQARPPSGEMMRGELLDPVCANLLLCLRVLVQDAEFLNLERIRDWSSTEHGLGEYMSFVGELEELTDVFGVAGVKFCLDLKPSHSR